MANATQEIFYYKLFNTGKCYIFSSVLDDRSRLACVLSLRLAASDCLWLTVMTLLSGCLSVCFTFRT